MGIRLTWIDNNVTEQGHKVYRSDSTMDLNNLPSPLVSLGPDITVYDDGSIVEGQAYYYIVSSFSGGVEKFSAEVSIDTEDTAWESSSLFANEELGGCWNFNDVTTLYQNTAGTTQITSDGQSILYAEDVSGNGTPLIKPSNSSALLFRSAANSYAEGNPSSTSGSGARLLGHDFESVIGYPFTIMLGGDFDQKTNSSTAGLSISNKNTNAGSCGVLGLRESDQKGPVVFVYNTSGYTDTSAGATGGKSVNIITLISGSQYAEDGFGNVSSSLNLPCPPSMKTISIGGLIRPTLAAYPGNYTCGLFINRELTTQEKLDLTTWANLQVGI